MEDEINKRKQFLGLKVDTRDNILGVIYKITNTVTNKCYVGQTVSHIAHNNRYKPSGEKHRFNNHKHDAIKNSKKKQCTCLNRSIRKYGPDVFKVEVLEYCLLEHSDEREIFYIKELGTLSPAGYNLTPGGRKCQITEAQKIKLMQRTHEQFYQAKLDRYKDVTVDDQYISECNHARYGGTFYIVRINKIRSIFVSKHLPTETLKAQVYEFLNRLASNHAT